MFQVTQSQRGEKNKESAQPCSRELKQSGEKSDGQKGAKRTNVINVLGKRAPKGPGEERRKEREATRNVASRAASEASCAVSAHCLAGEEAMEDDGRNGVASHTFLPADGDDEGMRAWPISSTDR